MVIEVDIYERTRHLHEHEGRSQRNLANVLGVFTQHCEKVF